MVDFNCTKKFLFQLKLHHYCWRLDQMQNFRNLIQRSSNCWGWMIKNRNFHLTQLPGLRRHGMICYILHGIKTFLFHLKMQNKSLAAGAPPQTPLEELTTFYTLLERIGERWICFQSQFLGYATVVNLHGTKSFLFDLKCTEIAWRLGLRPRPRWGANSAPIRPPSRYRRGEG